MPSDTEILHQILAGVQLNRGEVTRLEGAITEMARSVTDLAKSAVRFEQNIEHLESRMEDEINRQRDTMTDLAATVRDLTDSVRAMQQTQIKLDSEIRVLKEAHEEDEKSKQWFWRAVIDKLIWPVIVLICAAVMLVVSKK